MRKTFLYNIFKSKYCIVIFIMGILLGYFLTPKQIFNGFYSVLGVLYITSFAIVLSCIVRIVKEKMVVLRKVGGSASFIVGSILGIGAMQVCGVGAPICGATIGAGIFSIFFPQSSMMFLTEYAVSIIIASILLQISSLYFMGCFRKEK